jgi:hypothetical protein
MIAHLKRADHYRHYKRMPPVKAWTTAAMRIRESIAA